MVRAAGPQRRRILTAALECISARGYDGTRLRDVAEEAGVSVGMIQHYFGSRERLLGEALAHANDQLVERFSSLGIAGIPPWERVLGMVRIVCEMPDLHSRGLLWIEMASLQRRHPQLAVRLQGVYALWLGELRDAVADGVEDGSFDVGADASLDDLVAILVAFFDGYEYEIASSLLPADVAELERRAVILARRLFRPRAG
ncbi:TetR/AcrR family transcriptional regulator [Leucobacter weissii]|uniref:TetR/AcrR family transcriptional regulator n=1 Tax=Leucobacter weissii TaxID=1983706 RepID=A0A939MM55_9MICO|nr:TetR/AcrR family transcriptional regulator [Leucobacter weissii]MBO1902415.1 TetR/AcrR family transcriptional regulator [Leucobacter weissii]